VLDVLTPPYAPACGRDCTYYREVFPPALVDEAGRPMAVPPDQVASWVRWQPVDDAACGRESGGGGGPEQPEQQLDGGRRRPRPESWAGEANGCGGDADAGSASPGSPHPWHTFAEQVPGHGALVGLEPVPMPADFVVERGVYKGFGVHGAS
jgi:hypothetical protein